MSATIVDGTVRRPAGPWTPAVHALLRHFEAVGFAGAPRALGVSDGVETLTRIDGARSYDPADDGFLGLVDAVWRSWREAYRLWGGVERRDRWWEAHDGGRCEYMDGNLDCLDRNRATLL